MSVSCVPNDLTESAKCFNGYGPLILKSMWIRLICAAINGETMTCDPETILAESNCILAAMSDQDMDASITKLLCDLVNGGGGGGGSDQIKTYVTDPNTELVVPGDQTKGAVAYPTVAGVGPTYLWNIATLTWE